MPKNPTKEVGNKGPCFRCGQEMICLEKNTPDGPTPRWCNSDGNSHYTKDGDCKDTVEKTDGDRPIQELFQTQKIKLEDINLSMETMAELSEKVAPLTHVILGIEYLVGEIVKDGNRQHIGMITKLITELLQGYIPTIIGKEK